MISLLFVCAGNKCRSPAAAAIFSKMAKDAGRGHEFGVDSAGTYAKGAGQPADQRMIKAAASRGYKISTIAKRVKSSDVYLYHMILAMDGDNLKYVQDMKPKTSIFRLAEAQLLCADGVPDPYLGDEKAFSSTLDQLERACAELLKRI